jgi:cyclic pyranopterin phosphate synthase
MIDRFGRKINYLRISVTDRCNLRCRYCMPEDGIKLLKHSDIMSFEEIAELTRIAVSKGITKLKLTGGEPLVRKGIVKLVEALAAIDGIEDFGMTTNGTLLAQYARNLAEAGLKRVNISLDTINEDRYRELTRCGCIEDVFKGIDAAQKAGFQPIKLNCVVGQFSNASDEREVKKFGKSKCLEVRIIRQMCFETGYFSIVEGAEGGDCPRCTRLRLSSDGKIYPCLFSDICFDARKLGAKSAIEQAVAHKPEAGGPCSNNLMHKIGG